MRKSLMLLAIGAVLYQTSCTSKKEETKSEEVKFVVSNPVVKDTIITENYVSQIQSIQHIELRAQERGYVQKIYIDEGQHVKKGQLLFQIMPNLYKAEKQKAQAEANFAEIEYKNTQILADSNVVAANELAMAKAEYQKAMANLALADTHLKFTEIRAPFDGFIGRFEVRLGSYVEEGELLTSLSDNSKMWVYYNVPEAEYLDYKTKSTADENTKVELLMANNQTFDHTGVVETIIADFNNETGNIPFRASFPNPEGLLRHGETGNVIMKIPFKNALIIPQKATFEVLDKKYVFVVNEQDQVIQKEIQIKAELPHLFIVEDGLTVNDKILLEGIRMVKNEEKIHYELEQADKVLASLEMYAE
ncbi:membrane fusion protein, multidrug efflux system [Zhouia amylolytica]|uniref:RND family efflux transporter, MFP subunit n=2 Tax=Zhouia amylolytica TaxID=376730 RepID=W2UK34_9FLAO|nr:efflux RND transporter periplasmic adaptor subunit [Zhouia amylolytica]ETN94344.1 RND family efflux transporter, MFP subunit [Zhouia amylolytica AD3]MCQ0110426.1 efflux RND transporter periplasmic adaptor subunit [Zhouia amylolytica]SFT11158.1 membrane fusion protein, multidrug efflux system [Zhouia amylolytica]